MTEYKSHERPKWCPHPDCKFVLNTQEKACVGRLPKLELHDGVYNDSRVCLEVGENTVWDLKVNKGDLWNLMRLFKTLYPGLR